MRRVLVTHADEPLGRRVVKTLFHDPAVERLLAVGAGPVPHAFDRFLASSPTRLAYARANLARHRPASDLFHSGRVHAAGIDTVVHLPRHGAGAGATTPGARDLPARTAEARLVLQHCLEVASIRSLVALGSAFVYKRAPGNANRLTEGCELDLDPDAPPELRAWTDCDLLFHAEVGSDRLRVALLRVPTVVASGGGVYLHPGLEGPAHPRLRPLGFDPLCALIADKDVAKGVQAAVHARGSGVFNLAGTDALPFSRLARWTRRPSLPVPGPLLRVLAGGAQALGATALQDGSHLRFGFTLDTTRAERELGFTPGYRVGLARQGDGSRRLETWPR